MLIEFNTSADSMTLLPADQIANINISADKVSVSYTSGQSGSFQGDYRAIEDQLIEGGFVKGLRSLRGEDYTYVNVAAAQKVTFKAENNYYCLCASFPEDEYARHNNSIEIYVSQSAMKTFLDGHKIVRTRQENLVLAK